MSQSTRDAGEEPEDESNNPNDTSECTSCSNSTSVSLASRKGSGNGGSCCGSSDERTGSTGSSDSDADCEDLRKHRHCHELKGHSDGNPISASDDARHNETGRNDDNLQSVSTAATMEQTPETRTSSCDFAPKNHNQAIEDCKYHSSNEGTLKPLLKEQAEQPTMINKEIETCDIQSYSKSHSGKLSDNMAGKVGIEQQPIGNKPTSPSSSYSNSSSAISTAQRHHQSTTTNTTNAATVTTIVNETQPRRILKPAPSPSPSLSIIDTNNNKNSSSSSRDGLSNIKRNNFSKSASGSRLLNKGRPSVCDCLSQDCGEKKHSNRRQFIEHYYNSRTQLSSANTSTSSFNISTPLNRLSECDAITKRLLSSPIRATNLVESPTRRVQVAELDKSRRASLGTNTMTDQVFLFSSNPYKSLELSQKKNQGSAAKGHNATKDDGGEDHDNEDNQRGRDLEFAQSSSEENDVKLKQQQQGRSLSVCNEETLNPRTRCTGSNHSSNLNRAISLACESQNARRLLNIIPLFGCDIKSLEQFTKLGLILPPVIDSAVNHILAHGINSIGIFRKSGVKSRILTLRQRIEANQNVRFDELNQNHEFSIYDIADLVKMWFRELKPVPLMTKELIKVISKFLNLSSTPKKSSTPTQGKTAMPVIKRGISSQQDTSILIGRSNVTIQQSVDPNLRCKIDSMISTTHKVLLIRALNFLAQISSRCESNQMTSQNLAICLTPSLCATESDQNCILLAQKSLEYCIDNYKILFGCSDNENKYLMIAVKFNE